MKIKISTTTIYYIYTGISALLFILIKNIREIYRIDIAELNALQLVLVGTTLEITGFIFEIPTGILADRYSRKLSVIIGLFLIGIGFIIEAYFPIFIIIIIGQVILGLGNTFTSGADEAWIADELGNEQVEQVFLKGAQIAQILSIIGILLSMFLGFQNLRLPLLVGGIVFILLACFLIIFMNENKFIKSEESTYNPFQHMKNTFITVVKFIYKKPVLLMMVLITLFHGLYSEGFDRLWTAHFRNDIVLPLKNPVITISLINLVALLLSIVSVEYIKRKLKKTGQMQKIWILFVINLLMVITLLGFALSNQFIIASGLYISFYIVRRINTPVYRAWLNQQLESKIRATALSTFGQLDSLGQIIGGPIIGFIAIKFSVSAGIAVASIILSPVIIIYFIYLNKVRKSTSL